MEGNEIVKENGVMQRDEMINENGVAAAVDSKEDMEREILLEQGDIVEGREGSTYKINRAIGRITIFVTFFGRGIFLAV